MHAQRSHIEWREQPVKRDARRVSVAGRAISAISRRPADEAVPALLKMAESLPDRELRRTAVQRLVRSKDPRAVAWLEQRLAK